MIIQELVKKENIMMKFLANTKEEAIKKLAEHAFSLDIVTDLSGFIHDVYQRESIVSTGIGYGIAIPHAKSIHVKRPSVLFAKSDEGIPFDSLDGKDAQLLFLIAMPEDGTQAHLKVLAMLSRKLMHQDFRDALLDATSADEVLALLYQMN